MMNRIGTYLLFIAVFLFCFSTYSSAATHGRLHCKKKAGNKISNKVSVDKIKGMQQVAAFRQRDNAERFAKQIRLKGAKVIVQKHTAGDKKTMYRVYAKASADNKSRTISGPSSLEKRASGKEKISGGPNESGKAALYAGGMRDSDEEEKFSEEEKKIEGVPPKTGGPEGSDKAVLYEDGVKDAGASRELPSEEKTSESISTKAYREVEVSHFNNREDAESFAQKLREGGFEPTVRVVVDGDNVKVYKVFVLVHDGEPVGAAPLHGETGRPAEEEKPVGTLKSSRDAMGRKINFLHSSLTVSEIYTDNTFNTNGNKKSDLSTVLTPEIWLLLPGTDQKPLAIEETSVHSSGGLLVGRLKPDILRRYYTYFDYRADIPVAFTNSPAGNTVRQRAAGRFIYNFGNSLYADLIEQFEKSYETRQTSIGTTPTGIDKYSSNLFSTILYYDTSHRIRLRLDYSNFLLSYSAPENKFKDRTDNTFSGYLFYKLRPRTAAFVEYSYVDIKYDSNDILDSKEQYLFGGLQWDITAKSVGSVKAGYGAKDFVNAGTNHKNLILEAQFKHKFSSKNSVELTAFRKTNETNFSLASFILVHGAEARYQHLLAAKITGLVDLSYIHEKYLGETDAADIKDNLYQSTLGLQYEFKKWLKSAIGYTFTERNSNFPDFNYINNTIFFTITGSL